MPQASPTFLNLRLRILFFFKKEAILLYKLHHSKEHLHSLIDNLITKYLYLLIVQKTFLSEHNRILSFLILTIRRYTIKWAKKKHHRVSKARLKVLIFSQKESLPIFANTFKYIRQRFSLLKSRDYLLLPYVQDSFITNLNEIDPKSLIYLKNFASQSVIYSFWYSKNPSICYIGSSSNICVTFHAHLNNTKYIKKHHKFYNFINKYGKINKNFQIIECVDIKDILIREQFWLDLGSSKYPTTILNILTSDSTKGRLASPETRSKI